MDSGMKENQVKKTGRREKKWNSIDLFILLALLALLLTPLARLFGGKLLGPSYNEEARIVFSVEGESIEAANAFREGDTLQLAESGAQFGTVLEFTPSASKDGLTAGGSGALVLRGADTDGGFRTKDGDFVIPFESYTVTNGSASLTLTVSEVQVIAGN